MAEAAQAEAGAATSPTDIKQEPNPLDGFDFSLSPDMSSKRPLESAEGAGDNGPEAKRPKTDDASPDTVEDEAMSLIVQNALTDINNIISSFGGEPDGLAVPTTEPEAASGAPAQESQPDPVDFVTDPTKFVRDANIHALATIAVSMLLILSHDPFDQVAEKMRDPASEQRLRFQQLHRSLEALRVLYSERPILLIDEFDMHQTSTIIRLVNLAQLGWWIFDGKMESLREVELYLPTVFRDEIIGLPRQIVDLLVSVKTHRAINARQAREDKKLPEAELTETFLENVEQKLREQNIADQVIGSEKTVTDCLRARMEEMRGLGPEADPSAKYPADGMLRSLGLFSRDQLSMATELGERLGLTMPPPPPADHTATHTAEVPEIDGMDLDDLSSFFEKTASGHVESVLAGLNDEQMHPPSIPNGVHTATDTASGTAKQEETVKTNGSITDYKELEALVAESTSNYVRTTLQVMAPTPYQPTVPTSTAESMAAQPNYMHNNHHHAPQNSYYTSFPQATPGHEQHPQQQPPPPPVPGQNLPPNQTCSTSLLYEKARQAALSKQTAHPRREGNHSTRRPWSQEEEKALMTGLDMVKGPHWSQILSLFGPNGSVSDILKDRTQVQLKDKARNLKLFFLKTNSEMPYYLNLVTGELKTRAPTQAARKEAEERARLNSEDEQSRLQGTMASPGGLHQNRTQSGAVGPIGSGVVTPAQAAAHAAAAGQNRVPKQPASASTTPGSTAASTPTTYNRPQGPATTNGQSVSQPPPRPQNQLPPQIPRPQPQPQPQRPPQQVGQAPGYGAQNTVHQAAQQIIQQLNLHQSPQPSPQPAQRETPTQASPPPQAGSAQQSHGSSATTPMATPTYPSPPPNKPPSSSSAQPQYPHQYNQHAQSASQSPAPGAPPQASSAQQSPATPAPAPATPQPDRPAAPPNEQHELDKDSDADLIRNMAAVAQSIHMGASH